MSGRRRPDAAQPATPLRAPERRRFLAALLGVGAVGVLPADAAAAKPVDDVLDGGRP